MKKHYYVASPGLLGVCTNYPDFKWSYGMNMPQGTLDEFESCRIRIRLTVVDQIEPREEDQGTWGDLSGKYHYFSGIHNRDIIRYKRNFLFGSELQIEAHDLLTEEPHLIVNKNYYKYITHRFMNLHSIGYILTDLASLLLLNRGFSPIHCSSFNSGDSNVVILAPPNTGKTLSTMMACMEYGAGFIAEDLAITDGKTIYSVPWTSTFRYYSKVDQSRFNALLNRMTEVFPPLELLPLTKNKPINDYVESRRLIDSATITHVVILERGQEGVFHEEADEAYRKALNLNRYEFNYHRAPIIVAHEFFNPGLNIDEACLSERKILREMIDSAKELLVVRTNDASRYAGLLIDHLGKR